MLRNGGQGAIPMMKKRQKKGGKENKPRFKIIPFDFSRMAKKKGAKGKKVAFEVVTPVPKSFFEELKEPEGTEKVEPPKIQKCSSQQVYRTLRTFGKGWNKEIEKLLDVPKTMFFSATETSRHFSKSKKFGLTKFLDGLLAGRLLVPETEFGIILYETSSKMYFVLFDKKRRIVVKESLVHFFETPPQKNWKTIKDEIKSTLERARSPEARREGLFAVYDERLLLLKPEM